MTKGQVACTPQRLGPGKGSFGIAEPEDRTGMRLSTGFGESLANAINLAGLNMELTAEEAEAAAAVEKPSVEEEEEPPPPREPLPEPEPDEEPWTGGALPEMDGRWCSRSEMKAGDETIILRAQFGRTQESFRLVRETGSLDLRVGDILPLGTVEFERTTEISPQRICQEWLDADFSPAPEAISLMGHDNTAVRIAFGHFWSEFEELWELDNLNEYPCGNLLLLTERREVREEDQTGRQTESWRCD